MAEEQPTPETNVPSQEVAVTPEAPEVAEASEVVGDESAAELTDAQLEGVAGGAWPFARGGW